MLSPIHLYHVFLLTYAIDNITFIIYIPFGNGASDCLFLEIKRWIIGHSEAIVFLIMIWWIVYQNGLTFHNAIYIISVMVSYRFTLVHNDKFWNAIKVHILEKERGILKH